jgi:iron complex outermembrane receptor protein
MQDNMQVSNGQTTPALATLPTSGAQMPDTPRWMAGLRLAYETGTWYGNADVKYTGSAYSTLVNDDAMSDYAVVNASIGYRFQSALYFKKPSIQFNVSNLFGQEYLRISSPSGSSFATTANGVNGIKASPPSYYVSAPMYLSVTLRADF